MHHSKAMSDTERQRVVSQLDMTPISEEYELELRLVSVSLVFPTTFILFFKFVVVVVVVVIVLMV
jgi:hypothetical protein